MNADVASPTLLIFILPPAVQADIIPRALLALRLQPEVDTVGLTTYIFVPGTFSRMKAVGLHLLKHLIVLLVFYVSFLLEFKFLVIRADGSDAELSRHKFTIASGEFPRRADRIGIAHARASVALLAFCWHSFDSCFEGDGQKSEGDALSGSNRDCQTRILTESRRAGRVT